MGYVAVSLFFVLSGYILGIVYGKFSTSGNLRDFWLKRFARIYPIYVISLLADVPRLAAHRIAEHGVSYGLLATGATLGAQFAMLQAWFPGLGGLNFPSWSLSTEALFYLLFPALIVAATRIRTPRAAIGCIVAAWLASLAAPLIFAALGYPLSPGIEDVLARNPVLRLPEFCAGVALSRIDRNLPKTISLACLLLGAAIFLFVVEFSAVFCFLVISNGMLIPGWCLLIMGLASSTGLIFTLFSNKLMVLLGEASYSLYLIHIPFWYGLNYLFGASALFEIKYLVAVIGSSVLIFQFVERPLRVWIVRQFSPRLESGHLRIQTDRLGPRKKRASLDLG